jgi:hypothetical protein
VSVLPPDSLEPLAADGEHLCTYSFWKEALVELWGQHGGDSIRDATANPRQEWCGISTVHAAEGMVFPR